MASSGDTPSTENSVSMAALSCCPHATTGMAESPAARGYTKSVSPRCAGTGRQVPAPKGSSILDPAGTLLTAAM
eukprot:6733533-Prymnesium_polylepis.1